MSISNQKKLLIGSTLRSRKHWNPPLYYLYLYIIKIVQRIKISDEFLQLQIHIYIDTKINYKELNE